MLLTVNFCLAQKTNRTCHVGIIPVIVWIVLAANLLKVMCFFRALVLVRRASEPLITTGDMIQSFILKPDPNLSRRCLASISQVKKDPGFWTAPSMPLQWLAKRRLWFCGASLSMWLSLFLPAIIGMASVIGLYAHNDLNSFLSLGFSSSSSFELVRWNVAWNLNHGLLVTSLHLVLKSLSRQTSSRLTPYQSIEYTLDSAGASPAQSTYSLYTFPGYLYTASVHIKGHVDYST